MSGINFLSTNLIDTADLSLTTGTENSQFPLSNLQNVSTARKFRSTGNGAVIEIDLGQVQDIDTIAIVGDATSTLGITAMSVKTSTTTTFSGTATNISLSAEFNIGYSFITEVSHRYVEITLTGNGVYCELSNIFIGKRTNLDTTNLSIDSFEYLHDDNSKTKTNAFGQKFIDQYPLIKQIGGDLEYCTKSEQDILDTMFLAHGVNQPLWIIVDPDSSGMTDGNFKLAMYGYLTKMPKWSASGGQTYNTSITMEQVI